MYQHVTPFNARRGNALENRYALHPHRWTFRSYERAPRLRGSSCFRDTPVGKAPGAGYWWRGVYVPGSWQSFPWAVGFFFGNIELSLELWTVIAVKSEDNDD